MIRLGMIAAVMAISTRAARLTLKWRCRPFPC
jgi:hypothetical protein